MKSVEKPLEDEDSPLHEARLQQSRWTVPQAFAHGIQGGGEMHIRVFQPSRQQSEVSEEVHEG